MSAATSLHGVSVEHCARCGRDDLLPRGFCARCGSKEVAPRVLPGIGTVWSVTTLHRPARTGLVRPVTIALVTLEEGPRVMIRTSGALSIGTVVELANSGLGEPPQLVRSPSA